MSTLSAIESLQLLCRMFPLCNAREYVTDYAEELSTHPETAVYVETINTAKTEQMLRNAHLALGGVIRVKLDSLFAAQKRAAVLPSTVVEVPKNTVITNTLPKLSKKARAKLGMQPGEATTQAHREAYARMSAPPVRQGQTQAQAPAARPAPIQQTITVPQAQYVPERHRAAARANFFADARRVTGTQMGVTEKADALMKADMRNVSFVDTKREVITAEMVMEKHRDIIMANASCRAVYVAFLGARMSGNVALDAIKRSLSTEHAAERKAERAA